MTTELAEPALNNVEQQRLSALEARIEAGIRSFVDVGLALQEIRDGKLYRDEYRTFQEYCREKWNFNKQWAYKLIDGAQVVNALPTETAEKVNSTNAAVELGKVPEENRAELVEELAEEGGVTEASVREKAKGYLDQLDEVTAEIKAGMKGEASEDDDECCMAVKQCYEDNKARWNAIPPATPMQIVDDIVRYLKGEE